MFFALVEMRLHSPWQSACSLSATTRSILQVSKKKLVCGLSLQSVLG